MAEPAKKKAAEAKVPAKAPEALKKLMDDYSGPFNPDLKLEDLSQKALIKLAKSYSLVALMLHWGWRQCVNEKYGEKVEYDMWKENWLRVGQPYCERMAHAFKITDMNVIGFFKELQLDPFFPMYRFEYKMEIINPNHGVMTVTRCPALLQWEATGDNKFIALVCHDLEQVCFEKSGQYFHPNLKFKELKVPPRKSPDEICCKWDVTC
jgi:hypothetical protein